MNKVFLNLGRQPLANSFLKDISKNTIKKTMYIIKFVNIPITILLNPLFWSIDKTIKIININAKITYK